MQSLRIYNPLALSIFEHYDIISPHLNLDSNSNFNPDHVSIPYSQEENNMSKEANSISNSNSNSPVSIFKQSKALLDTSIVDSDDSTVPVSFRMLDDTIEIFYKESLLLTLQSEQYIPRIKIYSSSQDKPEFDIQVNHSNG